MVENDIPEIPIGDGTSGGNGLLEAVRTAIPEELQYMVLDKQHLPAEFVSFDMLREAELDNESMAKNSFGNRTADDLRKLGRVTGYVREFVVPQGAATLQEEPSDIVMCATVAHLFDDEDSVKNWIDEIFIKDFRNHVGEEMGEGQRLEGAELLSVSGFHDYSAGLLAIHEVPDAVLASTIVDFRVGRLLGVAYVVAKRDMTLLDLATDLGLRLERQMVGVVLGSV